jgi:type IX secretion system PorP/SprF family membrane protein
MKKVVITLSICFLNLLIAKAQQEPMYSQYMFNMGVINPAYVGSHGTFEATALFRKQWIGIQGAPSTSTVGIDIPDNKNGLGIGVQLVNDAIGIEKTNSLAASFSYRTHLANETDELSFGLLASIANFQANYSLVDLIQTSDPKFSGQVVNAWFPNVGAGIYYHSDNFYAGFSAPSLLTNTVDGNTISLGASAASNVLIAHYFITSGFVLDLNNNLKLKPSVLMKSVPGSPVEFDFNTNLWINDLVCVGLSYRTRSAFVGMLEFQFSPEFRLGYSYDKDVTNLAKYTIGSHEILLKYSFNKGNDKVYHPRYF